MIYKKGQYGEKTDVTIIEFGKGTLIFNSGLGQETDSSEVHSSVLLKSSKEVLPIGGTQKSKDKNSNDFNPEVAIVFHCVESIDAFMDKILEARTLLVKNKKV